MTVLQKEISGFVMAGGKSSRMGRDKGLISFRGQAMIEYSIKALQEICSSICIISNNTEYESLSYPVYPDMVKEKGPLAGICTALSLSKTYLNVIISCDSPFVSMALLSYLIEQSEGFEAVVPSYKGKLYPLSAVYAKSCYTPFNERLMKDELRVKDAISFVKTKQLKLTESLPFFDEKILANINTIKELEIHEN